MRGRKPADGDHEPPENKGEHSEGKHYPCKQGARSCCGGICGSTFAMRDAGPSRDSISTNYTGTERSKAACSPTRAEIFPPDDNGTKWTCQVPGTKAANTSGGKQTTAEKEARANAERWGRVSNAIKGEREKGRKQERRQGRSQEGHHTQKQAN